MIDFTPTIRPAKVPLGYSIVGAGDSFPNRAGFECYTTVSQNPTTVFPTTDLTTSAGNTNSMSGNVPFFTHGWMRFNNAPFSLVNPAPKLSASAPTNILRPDGSTLVHGYPTAMLLTDGGITVTDVDATLTVYYITTDFDASVLTWAAEPALGGFPSITMSAAAQGSTDIGLRVPLSIPCYGLVTVFSPAPTTIPPVGFSNANTFILGIPYLLVRNA